MPYTCPCCGYKTFSEAPGSDEICSVCHWQDDISQLRFPESVGANKLSLVEAQKKYMESTSPNKNIEMKNKNWRPLDVSKDKIEVPMAGVDYGESYPLNATDLYYWNV